MPQTPELFRVAERIIWFQSAEQSLNDPVLLLTYAMNYASFADMKTLLNYVGKDGLIEAIDAGLPGIVSPRSWSYWNLFVGRTAPPPLPKRVIS